MSNLEFYCDTKRHLVCKPYSITNLHTMAYILGIGNHWFHKDHYDISLNRISEISEKSHIISMREIYKIIHGLDEIS